MSEHLGWFRFLWGSCCLIFGFLWCVLETIACQFVSFLLPIALSVLLRYTGFWLPLWYLQILLTISYPVRARGLTPFLVVFALLNPLFSVMCFGNHCSSICQFFVAYCIVCTSSDYPFGIFKFLLNIYFYIKHGVILIFYIP